MTNAQIEQSTLFTGIYGIPEAARYLSNTLPFTNGNYIEASKLHYWIRTSVPYIAPSLYPSRQRLITFLDLISMRMIAILRSRGLKLREIKNHEIWLKREFSIKYPFVNRDLWTAGSHVYIKFHNRLWASSKYGQQAMKFIEDWLTKVELDMEFNEYDLASSWCPYSDIQLDPEIQLGEPCIEGTRIPTSTIWSKYKAKDSEETIAKSHNISVSQVQHAIEWEKRIVATKV